MNDVKDGPCPVWSLKLEQIRCLPTSPLLMYILRRRVVRVLVRTLKKVQKRLPKPSCHASVFLSFVSDRVCNRPDDIKLMGRSWYTKRLIEVASLCKQMNFHIAYLTTNRASCRCAAKGSFIIVVIMPANSSSYKIKMSFQPAG